MTLEEKKQKLIDYLKMKVEESDWHGVADAAMDLREIEIYIKLFNEHDPSVFGIVNKQEKDLPPFPPNRILKQGQIE